MLITLQYEPKLKIKIRFAFPFMIFQSLVNIIFPHSKHSSSPPFGGAGGGCPPEPFSGQACAQPGKV